MDQKTLFGYVQPRLRDFVTKHDVAALCDFIGVVPGTIQTWAKGTHPAQGVNLIRLWHFMAAAEYDSPEMDTLHPYTRYVGELLAHSIITIDDAGELFGVKTIQSTHQHLRGMHQTAQPAFQVDELKGLYDEQLQKEKQKLRDQLLGITGSEETETMVRGPSAPAVMPEPLAIASEVAPVPPNDLQFARNKEAGIMTLATLLSSALPLARNINSDNCTPADRSRLRDLLGEGGVFELSNILNALCSERARTDMKGM